MHGLELVIFVIRRCQSIGVRRRVSDPVEHNIARRPARLPTWRSCTGRLGHIEDLVIANVHNQVSLIHNAQSSQSSNQDSSTKAKEIPGELTVWQQSLWLLLDG